MKIATKGPLECVSSDWDALHAQSRGMNKESAAAMWAKKKKIERNVSRFRTTIEPKNTWNSRIFSVQNIKLLLFKIKGIRSYDARAYSSFVLSVFFVFKLTPTRISSIVKKFIDKQVKCFCYYRWIQDSANRWYRKISFNTQDGKTIKIEIIFLFRALTLHLRKKSDVSVYKMTRFKLLTI